MTSMFLGVNSLYAQETPQGTTDVDSELEARLLGEIEEVPEDTYTTLQPPEVPLWIIPFGIVILAVLVFARWKKSTPISIGEIRKTSVLPLGREGSLAIIEVGTVQGETKRLLIGLHDNSAPRLIVKLDNVENFESFLDRVDVQQSNFSDQSPPEENLSPNLPEPVLEDRNDLISDLLQARGFEQYRKAANESSSTGISPVQVEEEDEDPWAVNFRMIHNEKSKDE
jgi:hypothetical protein